MKSPLNADIIICNLCIKYINEQIHSLSNVFDQSIYLSCLYCVEFEIIKIVLSHKTGMKTFIQLWVT